MSKKLFQILLITALFQPFVAIATLIVCASIAIVIMVNSNEVPSSRELVKESTTVDLTECQVVKQINNDLYEVKCKS